MHSSNRHAENRISVSPSRRIFLVSFAKPRQKCLRSSLLLCLSLRRAVLSYYLVFGRAATLSFTQCQISTAVTPSRRSFLANFVRILQNRLRFPLLLCLLVRRVFSSFEFKYPRSAETSFTRRQFSPTVSPSRRSSFPALSKTRQNLFRFPLLLCLFVQCAISLSDCRFSCSTRLSPCDAIDLTAESW